jgi:hypothetical protein
LDDERIEGIAKSCWDSVEEKENTSAVFCDLKWREMTGVRGWDAGAIVSPHFNVH